MGATITIIFYLLFSIIWLTGILLTLIHQAKEKRWVWFIITFLFQITAIVYWVVYLIDKKFRKKKQY